MVYCLEFKEDKNFSNDNINFECVYFQCNVGLSFKNHLNQNLWSGA